MIVDIKFCRFVHTTLSDEAKSKGFDYIRCPDCDEVILGENKMISIYSELIKAGVHEEAASRLQDVVNIHDNLVTKDYLDSKLHAMESRILYTLVGTMVSMTAIFAFFVAFMRN